MVRQDSEVEIAYQLLRQQGQPMYFKDVIKEAVQQARKVSYVSAHAIAEVHTQINMDSRFAHAGKGMWGLAEWAPRTNEKAQAAEEAAALPTDTHRRSKLFESIQPEYIEQSAEFDKE